MNNTKVLFIVPHYNNHVDLGRCIKSIIANVLCNFEIIVIDDGSTEYHRSKILEFESLQCLKIVFLNFNQGVSKARNVGLNHAIRNNFSHVLFVDSDDHLTEKISSSFFGDSDLVFFESVETIDCYSNFEDFKNYIIKKNANEITSLPNILTQYNSRPNKVSTLVTCWGKVYRTKIIEDSELFFNTQMHAFEDIDFLLRFLCNTTKISFINKTIYAHTNSDNYNSLTFGGGNKNRLFSFLKLDKPLKRLFDKYHIKYDKYHFMSCYYSISLVRAAIGRKSLLNKLELYKFLVRRIRSRFIKKCFSDYNVKRAGGRELLRRFVLLKTPFLLTIYLLFIAKRRYN